MLADVHPALTVSSQQHATPTEHAVSLLPSLQIDLSGHGRHMGMDVVWQLKLRPDGAFLETGVAEILGAAAVLLLVV